jgi:hypothetical protein
MKISSKISGILALVLLSFGCVSVPASREGVQGDAVALNPARIAAFTPILMPHPVQLTSIDPTTAASAKVQTFVESRILASFKNQPNVNGISFQSVRTALTSYPRLAGDIDSEMKAVGQLTNSGIARETLLLSKECRARKNFLDFYKHCLVGSQKWISHLNQFSSAVQNTDSILIPVITALEKMTENDIYSVRFGVALLLVDTNSGKLIWGRDALVRIESPLGAKQFPDLQAAMEKVFNEAFWAEFPGRRSRAEAGK